MTEWIDAGIMLPALAFRGREAVAFALWIVFRGSAYYASGASIEDDVQHAVIWRSLLALRARGVRVAELGWQGKAETEEERGIEHFKRGFGGRDVPVIAAELEA